MKTKGHHPRGGDRDEDKTANHSGKLNGRTPVEFVSGVIPNISELLDFAFYDKCWY